jgi:hypothetical protein
MSEESIVSCHICSEEFIAPLRHVRGKKRSSYRQSEYGVFFRGKWFCSGCWEANNLENSALEVGIHVIR